MAKEDIRSYSMEEIGETLRDLEEKLEVGLADIEAGRVKPAEEVFARLRARTRGTISADARHHQ